MELCWQSFGLLWVGLGTGLHPNRRERIPTAAGHTSQSTGETHIAADAEPVNNKVREGHDLATIFAFWR
jgi:hypothetical protein